MAVTFIDPAQGALAQSLGALGKAAVLRGKREQIREDELMKDPKQMQALAMSFRAAETAGQGGTFLQSIGVRPGFAQALQSFRPTSAEVIEVESLKTGLPKKQVEAAGIQAQVITEEGSSLITSGVIGERLSNELGRLTLDSRYLTAASSAGLPELRAGAEESGFILNKQTNEYESELVNLRVEGGLPRLTVNMEALDAKAAASKSQLFVDSTAAFRDYVGNLPDTPAGNHLRNMAAASITNPAFANHVLAHEQMNLASARRLAAGTGDPSDRLLNYTRWRTAMTDALDRAEEADGSEERAEAIRDVNGLKILAEEMILEGSMLPIEITGAREGRRLFGLRATIERFGIEPELVDPMTIAAEAVISGQRTLEDLKAHEGFQGLSKENQIKLVAAIAAGSQPSDQTSPFLHQSGVDQQRPSTQEGGFVSALDATIQQRGVAAGIPVVANMIFGALGSKGFTPAGPASLPTSATFNSLSAASQGILNGGN